MKKRQGDARTAVLIGIEGLKGKSVAELCHELQISQALDYQWRDQFPAHAAPAFEVQQHTRKEAGLAQENTQLKQLVGGLTLEVNKSGELLG
jgi:hypothetical protein